MDVPRKGWRYDRDVIFDFDKLPPEVDLPMTQITNWILDNQRNDGSWLAITSLWTQKDVDIGYPRTKRVLGYKEKVALVDAKKWIFLAVNESLSSSGPFYIKHFGPLGWKTSENDLEKLNSADATVREILDGLGLGIMNFDRNFKSAPDHIRAQVLAFLQAKVQAEQQNLRSHLKRTFRHLMAIGWDFLGEKYVKTTIMNMGELEESTEIYIVSRKLVKELTLIEKGYYILDNGEMKVLSDPRLDEAKWFNQEIQRLHDRLHRLMIWKSVEVALEDGDFKLFAITKDDGFNMTRPGLEFCTNLLELSKLIN